MKFQALFILIGVVVACLIVPQLAHNEWVSIFSYGLICFAVVAGCLVAVSKPKDATENQPSQLKTKSSKEELSNGEFAATIIMLIAGFVFMVIVSYGGLKLVLPMMEDRMNSDTTNSQPNSNDSYYTNPTPEQHQSRHGPTN